MTAAIREVPVGRLIGPVASHVNDFLAVEAPLAGCGKIAHDGYLETRVAVFVLCEATTSSKAGYLATGRPRSGCRKIIRCGR
jgi:hypothetical protein